MNVINNVQRKLLLMNIKKNVLTKIVRLNINIMNMMTQKRLIYVKIFAVQINFIYQKEENA